MFFVIPNYMHHSLEKTSHIFKIHIQESLSNRPYIFQYESNINFFIKNFSWKPKPNELLYYSYMYEIKNLIDFNRYFTMNSSCFYLLYQ